MDTAPHAALRRPELVTDIEASRASEPARALAVMAVYQLSEAGRKASLLWGGDGRALQQLRVQVPIVNVPFRLIYYYNPNAKLGYTSELPWIYLPGKRSGFRFTVGRTF
jgi:hypothetical protein